MAATSKDKKLARSFKERLDQLSCPYTENVEEGWILELLFTPGEPRIRLLQWLFSKFDSKLNDLLDPQHAPADTKMDSRIQRLLFVSSNLGLCNPDEADLIRGISQGPRQTAFMDTLLDMVCIVDNADSPNSWSVHRPGISPSNYKNLGDQFSTDCDFVDTLASRQPIQNTFKAEVKLLPPDIVKQLEMNKQDRRLMEKENARIPSLSQLAEDANHLSKTLQKQTEVLKEIKKMHQCPDKDFRMKATVKQTVKLVLSEFDQLITSFSCCYDNDMRHWCAKTPPQLSQIGPCFKRVHSSLQKFLLMTSGIQTTKTSFRVLCTDMRQNVIRIRSELVQMSENQIEPHSARGILVESLANSLKSSVGILEESLLRAEQSFASGATTLDASSIASSAIVKVQ